MKELTVEIAYCEAHDFYAILLNGEDRFSNYRHLCENNRRILAKFKLQPNRLRSVMTVLLAELL